MMGDIMKKLMSHEAVIENIEEGMYTIPTENQKIMQESEYMNEFANNLSELD